MRLLRKALESRFTYTSFELERCKAWKLTDTAPFLRDRKFVMKIGFVHKKAESLRNVEYGPSSDDEKLVGEFRRLWGSKAELRRFEDGRILHSVVWDSDDSDEARSQITGEMASYLISRHVGIETSAFQRPCLLSPLIQSSAINGKDSSSFFNARTLFATIGKHLRSLEDLPLSIVSTTPIAPELRSTSVFTPNAQRGDTSSYNPPLEGIIEFETSNRWPLEFEPLRQMKLALAAFIAKSYMAAHTGSHATVVATYPFGYLDLKTSDGYHFRFHLKSEQDSSATIGMRTDVELLNYRRPFHTTRMQILCSEHEFLSTTIRLFKRFVSCHLLKRHFSDECLELITARVFVDPAPFASAPRSPLTGLVRVLRLVSSWDWKFDPIFFEYEKGELPETLRETTRLSLSKDSSNRHALRIVTAVDINGDWWTSEISELVIERLWRCCTAALKHISGLEIPTFGSILASLFALC
ncbi:hypothetical protein HDU97_008339 [Phlyctochytrium planicorne]|nr:hypothetical protein HDU97_008339 [Phlyctochytrium planicorne]